MVQRSLLRFDHIQRKYFIICPGKICGFSRQGRSGKRLPACVLFQIEPDHHQPIPQIRHHVPDHPQLHQNVVGQVSQAEGPLAQLAGFQQGKGLVHNEPLSIDDYAASRHMSTCWFIRSFKQILKVTPMQYILSLRMSNAQSLLETTEYNISEIAEAVGYDNSLYFSRLFHKHIGVSPSEYRKKRTL